MKKNILFLLLFLSFTQIGCAQLFSILPTVQPQDNDQFLIGRFNKAGKIPYSVLKDSLSLKIYPTAVVNVLPTGNALALRNKLVRNIGDSLYFVTNGGDAVLIEKAIPTPTLQEVLSKGNISTKSATVDTVFGNVGVFGTLPNQNYSINKNQIITNSNFGVKIGENIGNNQIQQSNTFIGNNAGLGITQNAYLYLRNLTYIGLSAGSGATSANSATFIGSGAGTSATNASFSTFIGRNSGFSATAASSSTFIGTTAGQNATNANFSMFLGTAAGSDAINANSSVFIGTNSGRSATNAKFSTFIGTHVGYNAANASNSVVVGDSSLYFPIANTIGGYDVTILGKNVARTITSGHHVTILGNNLDPSTPTMAGETTIGDSGIVRLRMSNDEVKFPFFKISGLLQTNNLGQVTPTAVDINSLAKILTGTTNFAGVSVPSGTSFTVQVPLVGASTGDIVQVQQDYNPVGVGTSNFWTGCVISANTVNITYHRISSGTQNFVNYPVKFAIIK